MKVEVSVLTDDESSGSNYNITPRNHHYELKCWETRYVPHRPKPTAAIRAPNPIPRAATPPIPKTPTVPHRPGPLFLSCGCCGSSVQPKKPQRSTSSFKTNRRSTNNSLDYLVHSWCFRNLTHLFFIALVRISQHFVQYSNPCRNGLTVASNAFEKGFRCRGRAFCRVLQSASGGL